jgi:hypothetical protein
MLVVRTSTRALFLALIPSAIVQAVLLSLSLWPWEAKSFLGLPGPDGILMLFAVQMAIGGGGLFAGHNVLRHFAVYSRWAYAAMGTAGAVIAYLMGARYGILASTPMSGTWISAAIMPTLAGTLSGFLYGQFAGIEMLARDDSDLDLAAPNGTLRGRFEGPVCARTSLGAIGLTAFIPAVLVAILAFSIFQFGLTDAPAALLVALPARAFMSAMFITVIPSLILILIVHHTARALGFMRGVQYAGLGSAYGAAFALLAGPFTAFTSVIFLLIPLAVFGAIMGALYRRFAGLEPAPLPEALIVTDVETLASADDPRRRSHSILLNG